MKTEQPNTVPASVQGWRIDTSAGRPILVHNDCSVIEAEQADYVLRLIAADQATRANVAEGVSTSAAVAYQSVAAADEEAVRAAFRAADESGKIRHHTKWQTWRDAVAWCQGALLAATDALREDVTMLLGMLEEREYAEHWAKTDLGKRLESAITDLHSEIHDAAGARERVDGAAVKARREEFAACGHIYLQSGGLGLDRMSSFSLGFAWGWDRAGAHDRGERAPEYTPNTQHEFLTSHAWMEANLMLSQLKRAAPAATKGESQPLKDGQINSMLEEGTCIHGKGFQCVTCWPHPAAPSDAPSTNKQGGEA